MTLLAATNNAHKLAEIRAILPDTFTILSAESQGLRLEVEETGTTLEENALLKARAFHAATGLPALADDTGLFVDALQGAPGVHTARYAGPGATAEQNNAKLLAALEGAATRAAHFETAIALVDAHGREHVFKGQVLGRIAEAPRGEQGFGYDPLFIPEDHTGTFAELGEEVKHSLSHRARALAALAEWLAGSVV